MNLDPMKTVSSERPALAINGWLMLTVNLLLLFASAATLVASLVALASHNPPAALPTFLAAVLAEIVAILLLCGHFTLQPNEARVMILFGAYKGTIRASGFWWANPFYSRQRSIVHLAVESGHEKAASPTGARANQRFLSAKVSLRARNFNSEKVKVNDKRVKPIEIAAVVVWRAEDTA